MFKKGKKEFTKVQLEEMINRTKSDSNDVITSLQERIAELKKENEELSSTLEHHKERGELVTKAIYNAVKKADDIENLTTLKYNQEISQLKAFHEKWISYYNRILKKYPIDEDLKNAEKFNFDMRKVLERVELVDSTDEKERQLFTSSIESSFEKEKKRLDEKRIGYITVKTDNNIDSVKTDNDLNQATSSDIFSDDFDPVARIKNYLSKDKKKSRQGTVKKQSAKKANNILATSNINSFTANKEDDDYQDRAPSGFSFEEALNPKEDLEAIMRDLGFLLDEN